MHCPLLSCQPSAGKGDLESVPSPQLREQKSMQCQYSGSRKVDDTAGIFLNAMLC